MNYALLYAPAILFTVWCLGTALMWITGYVIENYYTSDWWNWWLLDKLQSAGIMIFFGGGFLVIAVALLTMGWGLWYFAITGEWVLRRY